VVAAPSIALNAQIGVRTTGIESYTLRGLTGDDTFNITAQANIQINVQGDDPGGSDVLNFTGTGGDVTLDLAPLTVTETGLGPVSVSGSRPAPARSS
jgi:hypothetical protein